MGTPRTKRQKRGDFESNRTYDDRKRSSQCLDLAAQVKQCS